MADEEVGVPFSQVYLRPAKPLRDSIKFRRRIASYYSDHISKPNFDCAGYLKTHYGIQIRAGNFGYLWTEFFEEGELSEVLDGITGIYQALLACLRPHDAQRWMNFVTSALNQEALGYRLDAACAVRIYVDDEFERGRVATLAGLGRRRYSSARLAYDKALKAMDGSTPDTLAGVRGVFEATEEVFRLMFASKASRLGTSEIDRCLRPFVSSRYQAPALNAVNKLVSSFADWVDGMHTYRHAQGVEDPSPPPLDVALLIMGEGSSFLRWLIDLDSTQTQV